MKGVAGLNGTMKLGLGTLACSRGVKLIGISNTFQSPTTTGMALVAADASCHNVFGLHVLNKGCELVGCLPLIGVVAGIVDAIE